MGVDGPVLICYDGSDGARFALEAGIKLLHAEPVVVACYWQPFAETSRRFSIHVLETVQDPENINARERADAEETAAEGAALVTAAGGTAESIAVKVDGALEVAILRHADEIHASAIVMGSRGRGGFGSILLGDIAGAVVQLSSRPVFVVPGPRLAERRRRDRETDYTTTN
jgi:nucleotide-binding universal stress UspA family protein